MSNKLRILVPVKRVIDSAIRPRVNKAQTGVETQGVKFSMNPFCDIGLEEALRLRERTKANSFVENIHAVSAGSPKSQEVLRAALAKGADDSTLIDMGEGSNAEPLTIAKMLKKIVDENKSNLVILGKQAIDNDNNQTGQMLAGLLNWPQATNASKVEVDEQAGKVTVTREIDGGVETVSAPLPMVVTTDLRLNEPRYASLPNIMKAKKKPMKTVKPEDLGESVANRIETLKVAEPPVRQAGEIVESTDDLVARLKKAGAV